jgi:transmembrane sensor
VVAGQTSVRAVGTAFSVRRAADAAVRVVVSEGVVEVGGGSGNAESVRLGHNMQADAVSGHATAIRTAAIDDASVQRNLSWLEGRIAFSGATLADAAAEFARYSDDPIVIDDPRVASLTVTGAFAANDPAGFADAVAAGFGLHVARDGKQIR